VWDVERNRVEYIGPRTHPRLAVARAVRMAIALPLFIEAVQYRGHHYWDGGTADILPVRPLLDIETPPDVVIAINGFYPKEFDGEDITGWLEKPGSILYAASQVREIQHIELARENLARLRREVPVVRLINPVAYEAVRGVGLYRQFLDNTMWPDFMRAGLRTTRRALRVEVGTPRSRSRPSRV
jgi:NTE family protein